MSGWEPNKGGMGADISEAQWDRPTKQDAQDTRTLWYTADAVDHLFADARMDELDYLAITIDDHEGRILGADEVTSRVRDCLQDT